MNNDRMKPKRRDDDNSTGMDLERIFFVLQRKNAQKGFWETQHFHTYRGRTDAKAALEKVRRERPSEQWRSLPKPWAERYEEGFKDALAYFESEYELIEEETSSEVQPNQ